MYIEWLQLHHEHVTKHFMCQVERVQWQLIGSCCNTHVVVGRSVEFILRDNCATAIVHTLTV